MLQDLAVIFEDAGSSIVMKDTPAVESISFNDIPSRIILKPDVFLPDALHFLLEREQLGTYSDQRIHIDLIVPQRRPELTEQQQQFHQLFF
jgi:hypothetical protein